MRKEPPVLALLRTCWHPFVRAGAALKRNGWRGLMRRAASKWHIGGWRLVLGGLFPSLLPSRADVQAAISGIEPARYAKWISLYDKYNTAGLERLTRLALGWEAAPTFSILLRVGDTLSAEPERAIDSLLRQSYPFWTLYIVADSGMAPGARAVLAGHALRDERIRVVYGDASGQSCAAPNAALTLCKGDYLVLMGRDGELPPHALHLVADAVRQHPEAEIIYSDEDKLDAAGGRFDPYFKPDWNPQLFLTQNLFAHLGVYRTATLLAIGGFREGYEGGQDYDLALRVLAQCGDEQVVHIPHVLYHRRILPESTAAPVEAKPDTVKAACRALADYLAATAVQGKIEPVEGTSLHRVRYAIPAGAPKVSIIIPTKDGYSLLRTCLQSLQRLTTYPNLEVIVIDNGSTESAVLEMLASESAAGRVRVLRDPESPFNYAAINNRAVEQATGEYICLMNNDIEIVTPDWLEEMLGQLAQPGVGAVGCKLLYPDGTLQHGGVIVGLGGVAGHAFHRMGGREAHYFGRAVVQHNVSAVTAACMLMRRDVFRALGGLDEIHLAVAFNDVDLCLRIGEAGLRIVFTPHAVMYHHESASRGQDVAPEKARRFAAEVAWMRERWGSKLLNDPAYSPNLTLEAPDFSLAFPPRVRLPV